MNVEVGDKVKFVKKDSTKPSTEIPLGSVGIATQVFDEVDSYPKHYDVVFNKDGGTIFELFYEGELEKTQ